MPSFVTIDYNKAQLREMAEGEFLTVPTGAIFTVRPSVFNVSPEPRGILVENRDQITVFFYVTGTMPVGSAVELEFFARAYTRPLGSVLKTMVVGATDAMVQFDITDDLLGEADFVQITYKFKQGTAYTVSQLLTNIKKFDSDETMSSLEDIADNTEESAASLAVIEANLSSIGVFIQECNTAADFAAVSDAQNIANDTEHVTGTASTEWDKTGGSNVISGVDDALAAPVDLSVFSSGDYITACFFLPSLTDVVKVHIQVGTDNANFTEWEWLVADLTTGWNLLYATLADYAALTGTGMQQGVVTYVQAAVEFGAAGDLLNDMKVDHIAFVTSESLSDPSSAAMLAAVEIIDDAVGAHGTAAAAGGMRAQGRATAALAPAVADGQDAQINTDLNQQVRGAAFDIAEGHDKVGEDDPISEHYLPVTPLFSDEAVVADPGASYAPDAAGHALTYGHVAAVQLYLRGGTGGGPVDRIVTATIEGSMGLLIAAAVRWVDVSKLVLNLNTGLSGIASWTSTGVTATEYLLSLGNVPFSHFRVKYTWSGAPDNTDGIIVVNAFKSAL